MGRFADIAYEISSNVDELVRRLTDIVNEELDAADERTYKAYAEIEAEKIKEVFDDAVREFYSAYTPNLYSRQGDAGSRSGGLFDVFNKDYAKDEYGMFDDDADPGFNSMFNGWALEGDPGRGYGGEPLFRKVFMLGWHGGAEGISGSKAETWGAHPAPGVPYYRKRGKVRYSDGSFGWHKYGKWGKRAVKTRSPYSIFKSGYRDADNGELDAEFRRLDDENFEIAMENVDRRQAELEEELFG